MNGPIHTKAVFAATVLTVLMAALTTATPTPAPQSPSPTALPSSSLETTAQVQFLASEMFCDWPRTTDNCRASNVFKILLIASSVCHLITGILGVWLMAYRNRGLNLKIVTSLFMYVGDGLRPKPVGDKDRLFVLFSFQLQTLCIPITNTTNS